MKVYKPLVNVQYEELLLDFDNLHKDLVRIRTESDGSCLFHAIAKSYYKPYIIGKIGGMAMNRKKFIRQLRADLSYKLAEAVDPIDPDSLTWYETISRGKLPELSKDLPEYSLENLQKLLDSNKSLGNIFNEFLSDQFDKDIYILDGMKKDVYITGDDSDILYKNRPSIVIYYLPHHYELVGLKQDNNIQTLFEPDHPLIIAIRNRARNIIQNVS